MKKLEKVFWILFFITCILFFIYVAISAVYGPSTGMESITTYIS